MTKIVNRTLVVLTILVALMLIGITAMLHMEYVNETNGNGCSEVNTFDTGSKVYDCTK